MSGRKQKQLRLGAFFNPTGHHVASWRHPDADADMGVSFESYVRCAQMAEKAKFDMVFLADNISVRQADPEALSRSAQYIANMEPITLISALSAVTKNIGFVATASTSYNEPYHVARKFASIDHISHGRAGWNLVTSGTGNANDAFQFGREEHYEHGVRYDRAREFARVVKGLWDSWDDDAFVRDKQSGIMFKPEGMHTLNHKGNWFSVRGPLNVPRCPQGQPVIVQAGGSEDMIATASEFAEVIFCAPLTVEQGKKFYKEIKGAMAKYDRDPESMKIMPGLSCYVGATEEEANKKYEYMNSLIHPIVAREILSTILGGYDLSKYDLDGPVPRDVMEGKIKPGSEGILKSIIDIVTRENLTIRQLAIRMAAARGKAAIKGTPAQIVDIMEEWFWNEACDGFNVMPPYLPGALDDFCKLIIPEMQRRGVFRTEYEGKMLRDNLGLPRPVSRYAKKPEMAAE